MRRTAHATRTDSAGGVLSPVPRVNSVLRYEITDMRIQRVQRAQIRDGPAGAGKGGVHDTTPTLVPTEPDRATRIGNKSNLGRRRRGGRGRVR